MDFHGVKDWTGRDGTGRNGTRPYVPLQKSPRPCASRRVEALTATTLQTSQNLQTKLLGGGFTLPLPPPTGRGRSAVRFPGVVGPSLTKSFAKMNIFCFWTRLGRTMTPSNPQLYTLYMPFDVYMPKVAPKWPQSGLEVEAKSPSRTENRPTT